MLGGSIGYVHVVPEDEKTHILSCAMGMDNVGVSPTQTKGVGSVKVANITYNGAWVMSSVLEGEEKRVFNTTTAPGVAWKTWTGKPTPYTWYQANLTAYEGQSYALELSTMWKGVAFVNGFNIGRYWMAPGVCSGACAPPIKNGHCYMQWDDCGKPTQTLYHVPSSVVSTTGPNLVTLFEETVDPGTVIDPSKVQLVSFSS
eukprot:TRINITY_DN14576_c0_g1_i1.p1 TRINITY_DN14576_c0_g1~~TRINITY_DN14576_c0_g1_i1.p1  ORF type:complete len:201 (+),score=35.20 TRINITY_DN14576_c0_g1_i1:568-1170(+)